ncbi:hypothetical protein SAMN06265374_2308 [Roseibium denhamense]|uniref:Uncharacterized protein n=1 Tax=Roseibium denhamense TaxID=76305 RepID=A0ABY1P296_9HYPH|nr:hypothetical protein SAMN06265374_2308 [Roseibium denhamense]
MQDAKLCQTSAPCVSPDVIRGPLAVPLATAIAAFPEACYCRSYQSAACEAKTVWWIPASSVDDCGGCGGGHTSHGSFAFRVRQPSKHCVEDRERMQGHAKSSGGGLSCLA